MATAKGPGTNEGNVSGTLNLTSAAVGNYVYTIGTAANNTTINISAPAGSTVILNITGVVGQNVNFNIAGGLTANDVLYGQCACLKSQKEQAFMDRRFRDGFCNKFCRE